MQTVATIGLDIAKSIFQVHGVDAGGQLVIHRRLIANPEPSTHGPSAKPAHVRLGVGYWGDERNRCKWDQFVAVDPLLPFGNAILL